MVKKGFNWKARQVVNTVIDDSGTKKIHLEIETKGSYDKSNELALPSDKRKTKIKSDKVKITRILSKKHRKRLEKIVERKQKKENRASLINALSEVQATPEELAKLTTISSVQTKGVRKYIWEEQNSNKQKYIKTEADALHGSINVNSIKGSKRLRDSVSRENLKKFKSNDPNVVGFDSSSESSNDTEDDDDEEEEEQDEEKIENGNDNIEKEVSNSENTNDQITTENVIKENSDNTDSKPKEDVKKNETAKKTETVEKPTIKVERKPSVFVHVSRSKEIQKARLKLPILAEEQPIMEKINENPVVILAGETGSGKTTQVPQFLYEAGYARDRIIGVTEPRRVAAISMSKRVAEEMNLSSKEVSYLIRFEGNATDDTKIKFMTDGVLLKEIQTDFLLTKYSAIILDEAHERSVYTDILIGFLSRIVKVRNKRNDPLKLIIMSATLRIKDFTENPRLFSITPPVIKVEARQFPVTCHFNKRTDPNYLKVAFEKTVKIHTKLPEGGILIFVTGQQEVNMLVKKLRNAFPFKKTSKNTNKENKKSEDESESDNEDEEIEQDLQRTLKKKKKIVAVPEVNLDDYGLPGDIDENMSGNEGSDDEELDFQSSVVMRSHPMWVLPLYSLLPGDKQAKVFQPPPEGCRLCVVSTNVAETSLTIPNIKYVVDTGKTKVKLYDKTTGVTSYVVTWTSKASADQRAGRAGRTGPGHCYRLYSSAVFNDVFEQFSVPEIQQKPIDDLYLQLKCMGIDNVPNFPFPSVPDLLQMKAAEMRLTALGALGDNKATPLGKAISRFPVLPRYGKMLALSHQHNLMPYTVCIVAALSVQEVLLETPIHPTNKESVKETRERWASIRRQWAGVGNSLLLGDVMVLLRAVGAAEYAHSNGKLEQFCEENGLRPKAITEIRKLRIQLTNCINMNIVGADVSVSPKLEPPNETQIRMLRQVLLAGNGDQLAKKISPDEIKENQDKIKYKYAYHANNMEEPVFLHQGSVLKKKLPEFVIFQEIFETNKMYMRGVTAIEPEWLPTYVPSLCQLSEPLSDPEPRYDPSDGKIYCTVTGTFGSQAWPLPNIEMVHPKTIEYYKWFGKYLLEGQIFEKLKKYSNVLLSNPNILVKSWAKLQPRTTSLLQALTSQDITTKSDLIQIWKENKKFLLNEYLQWLPKSSHSEFSLLWPPIDK